jgi:hypothetical protein
MMDMKSFFSIPTVFTLEIGCVKFLQSLLLPERMFK